LTRFPAKHRDVDRNLVALHQVDLEKDELRSAAGELKLVPIYSR
jgi:hypothetical protein